MTTNCLVCTIPPSAAFAQRSPLAVQRSHKASSHCSSYHLFLHHYFIVPECNGRQWPIMDLRALKKFIRYSKFCTVMLLDIMPLIPSDSWLMSINLQDTFFHIICHITVGSCTSLWVPSATSIGCSPLACLQPLKCSHKCSHTCWSLQDSKHSIQIYLFINNWLSSSKDQMREDYTSLLKSIGLCVNLRSQF